VTGGEPSCWKIAQCRPVEGGLHPSSFSLSASGTAKQPPSDEQRERQDYLFGLTGKTPLVLLPSMPNSLHK